MKDSLYRLLMFICLMLVTANSSAQKQPDAQEILGRIDDNLYAKSRISQSQMLIHGRRGSRTVVAKTWVVGNSKSFTEYLAPARERGTKMLKLDDQLWTYSPGTDRTIRISGHMLRQSVMGSDLSYEDLMEDPKLTNIYDAQVTGEDSIRDRRCWVLTLQAKSDNIAYHSRKMWVDQERFLPLREERFAKSGKLLKSTEIQEVQKSGDRWVVKKIVFKDELKGGQGTELIVDSVVFNQEIPQSIFSKAALRRS